MRGQGGTVGEKREVTGHGVWNRVGNVRLRNRIRFFGNEHLSPDEFDCDARGSTLNEPIRSMSSIQHLNALYPSKVDRNERWVRNDQRIQGRRATKSVKNDDQTTDGADKAAVINFNK